MDVICVEDAQLNLHCTEFYVKFQMASVDEAQLARIKEDELSAAVLQRDMRSMSEEERDAEILRHAISRAEEIAASPVVTETMQRRETESPFSTSPGTNTGSSKKEKELFISNKQEKEKSGDKIVSPCLNSLLPPNGSAVCAPSLQDTLNAHTAAERLAAPPATHTEIQWVDISVNNAFRPEINAFLGPGQLLYFFDPTTQRAHTTPSSKLLLLFNLLSGKNDIQCVHPASKTSISFHIFLYSPEDRFVVMDIDGTITKSDVTGYITTVFLGRFSYVHEGVVHFLAECVERYRWQVLYLTARPHSHRRLTLELLQGVRQHRAQPHTLKNKNTNKDTNKDTNKNTLCALPEGPLLMNRDSAATVLYREVVLRDTFATKAALLEEICEVFRAAGSLSLSPFVLGVGNKQHDAVAYNSSGIATDRILLVNPSSRLAVWRYSQQEKLQREREREREREKGRKRRPAQTPPLQRAKSQGCVQSGDADEDELLSVRDAQRRAQDDSALLLRRPSSTERERERERDIAPQTAEELFAQKKKGNALNGSDDDDLSDAVRDEESERLLLATQHTAAAVRGTEQKQEKERAQSFEGQYVFHTYADRHLLEYLERLHRFPPP